MVPSANVGGDPVAIVNAALQISATSAQLTADMGRKFLTQLGILPRASAPADPGITMYASRGCTVARHPSW